MAKQVMIWESEDGAQFVTREDCERHEMAQAQIYMERLKDEIRYKEVPLFEERRYGAYLVSPVTILTATPRSMKELIDIAEYMRKEISESIDLMPGFRFNPAKNEVYYAEPAAFPMTYSVMVERYRKRKHPIVKLFTGREFAKLANLITGHIPDSDIAAVTFREDEDNDVTYAEPGDSTYKPVMGFGNSDAETKWENAKRGRRPRMIEVNGETHNMSEWARIAGLSLNTISSRINILGWDPVTAVTTPAHPRKISG